MNAVLLRKGRSEQLSLDLGFAGDAEGMEMRWRNAEEGEKLSRARFAQRALHPDEVMPEWQRWRELLGSSDRVQRFVGRAMSRLDAPLEQAPGDSFRAHLDALPDAVKERLAGRGLEGSVRLSFEEPGAPRAEMVGRSHPLPATLAEMILEGALDPGSLPQMSLGRVGAWPTGTVRAMTTVALVRLRYKLTIRARREQLLLAEEAGVLAWHAGSAEPALEGAEARALLEPLATGDLADVARTRLLTQARDQIAAGMDGSIAAYARKRAEVLAADHARLRAAAQGSLRVTVEPVLPVDVMGLFVLVPAAH
jgi:hypothetical protein